MHARLHDYLLSVDYLCYKIAETEPKVDHIIVQKVKIEGKV